MGEDNKLQDAKLYIDGEELGEVKEIKCISNVENINFKEPITLHSNKEFTIKVNPKRLHGLNKMLKKIIETERLYNILIKTRKPRIQKKLFKRIMKVFEA